MSYEFIEQEGGKLRVFNLPEPGMQYSMGVDASTGLSHDYSVAQVLTNTAPCEQVAIFRAKVPVNQVSAFVNSLGRFYNEALNICEVNYPGNAVQDALLQYYQYPRNYQPETHLREDVDISNKYGFRTTELSKWLLIQETQMGLACGGIIIHDPVTISEFENFVYQARKSRASAAAGFTDDCVMALMFAYHGVKLYPFVRPKKESAIEKAKSKDPDTMKAWRLFRENIGSMKEGMTL